MEPLVVGIAVTSLSTAASALGLLLRRRAVVTAVLLLLAGTLGIAGATLLESGHPDAALRLLVLAAALPAPVALVVYPSPRWHHPVDVGALALVVGCGVTAAAWLSTDVIGVCGLAQGCVLLAHTWWRIEVSHDHERRALVWMALAASLSTFAYFVALFASENLSDDTLPALAVIIFAVVGPALYVGASLPDLVDVRGLVVGVVVTAVAMVTVMAVFVLELALLEALHAGRLSAGVQGVLAAVAALALPPTRSALRGVVDQLLFGDRPDPLGAASAVAGRIGADPVVALRAIREALVLPYAAVRVDGQVVATSGVETTYTRTLDLDGAGELAVGLRAGDLAFSRGDEQVLRLVVPLLAQTLRARALALDLLESRGQTITAVEEERRRLRRDLHDGLGPRLSGVAFTSDAARNLIRTDPAAAEDLVAQLRADTVTAIEEIRRLVYAMRPPALDELGLVPALRQHATGLRDRSGERIVVEVSAPDPLPALTAAVEVAAYRIVTEALTNVARHSSSRTACIELAVLPDGLSLEVTDDGDSSGGSWRPGVGLASMRERAVELGGSLEAGAAGGGGRVRAVLPWGPVDTGSRLTL